MPDKVVPDVSEAVWSYSDRQLTSNMLALMLLQSLNAQNWLYSGTALKDFYYNFASGSFAYDKFYIPASALGLKKVVCIIGYSIDTSSATSGSCDIIVKHGATEITVDSLTYGNTLTNQVKVVSWSASDEEVQVLARIISDGTNNINAEIGFIVLLGLR